MSRGSVNALEENRRRYYLDAMGIQCWESIDTPEAIPASGNSEAGMIENATTETETTETAATVNAGSSPWSVLNATVAECVDCVLSQTRQIAMAGRGSIQADVAVIILAPDNADESSATICSGEAGGLLEKMLAAINVSIDDVFITSLLKCRIPDNHTISPAEVDACRVHLQQQLSLLSPKVVLVLGEITMRCLLQKNLSLDDFRALNTSAENVLYGIPVFASYSPQELLQDAKNKRKAWQDLQQLQKQIDR